MPFKGFEVEGEKKKMESLVHHMLNRSLMQPGDVTRFVTRTVELVADVHSLITTFGTMNIGEGSSKL